MSQTEQTAQGAQETKVLTFEERLKQSPEKRAEKAIQQDVKSNLKSLKSSIEKTREEIDNATARRESLLDAKKVDWNAVVDAEDEMESLNAGLKRLKALRDTQFPNWKEVLVED